MRRDRATILPPELAVAGGLNTVLGEKSTDFGDNGGHHGSHVAGIIAGMDSVTWRLLVGGSLMLTGVFIVELLPSSKGVVEEIEAEEGTTP